MKAALVAAVCAAAMTAGCISPHNSYVAKIGTRWDGWTSVRFDNTDTVSLFDINIILRHNDSFVADSLALQISTLTPSGDTFSERFVIRTPQRHNAAALSTEVVVPYRSNALLSMYGRYKIAFKPETAITGIEAIGVNIEKANSSGER